MTNEALEDGELSLQMTGRIMEFDVEGNMMVNYSEKLVSGVCFLKYYARI